MRWIRQCMWVILALLVTQQGFFMQVARAEQPGVWFEEAGAASGVRNNRLGDERAIGQAWGDYDNDGWLDLYVTDSAGPNTLYRNQGDGRFSVVNGVGSENTATRLPQLLSGGAVFIDYDNDGWRDLYVLNWGPNVLFHNEQGRFVDVTAQAGVAGLPDANSQTASWGDYDADGYVDLYVANWSCYPRCGRPVTGDRDRLYHNNGDGTFADVTDLLGVKSVGAGFVANFVDYDNDGDPDIYLVNDEFINPIGNVLWRNDGPGCDGWCFTEVSRSAGADEKVMGMGLAATDYDGDGDLDFYFSNAGPMTLLQNQGDGTFVNMAESAGVMAAESVGWGAVAFDYDNDGWSDLYLAVLETTAGEPGADQLFHNQGDGTFVAAAESGVDRFGRTMGVATADYNRDGWVDLVIGNHDDGYHLYRNIGAAQSDQHWLSLELRGAGPVNRDAVGARVFLTTPDGRRQMQEVICGSSLGAGNALALHFGLGSAEKAQSVDVLWPDGTQLHMHDLAGDREYILVYTPPADNATIGRWIAPSALGLAVAIGIGGWLWVKRRRGQNSPVAPTAPEVD